MNRLVAVDNINISFVNRSFKPLNVTPACEVKFFRNEYESFAFSTKTKIRVVTIKKRELFSASAGSS